MCMLALAQGEMERIQLRDQVKNLKGEVELQETTQAAQVNLCIPRAVDLIIPPH